ncbi:hypothetical protein [Williamsia herbipolensis]|uniref:hypothetical protein n=1 Tax=Williamsia herbipolensis TaxID=1603258 RepID=UPI0005F77685|nr:hypothetical protein [Williamsia herbipolensis]
MSRSPREAGRIPDGWDHFDDFEKSWEFWTTIDSRSGHNLFDSLDLHDRTLTLSNGAGQPMNSEGYLQYFIVRNDSGFETKSFEISRGDREEFSSGTFSTFALAGKFAIATEVSEAVRQAVAPTLGSPTARLDEMGLNQDWEPDPAYRTRYPERRFRQRANANNWFVGDERFPSTSHYLSMSYDEINRSLSVGIDPSLVPELPRTII